MMPAILIETIRSSIQLPAEECDVIHKTFQKIIVQKEECWLKEGDHCRHLAFIEEGLLRFYINEDGQEITHFFAGAGEFVSNFESLLNQTPSRKNIQAIETATMWTISRQNLEVLYKETAQGERFGRLLMEKELLNTISRFLDQYTLSPEQRYQRFVQQYPHLLQRIPQYFIASFVGVQPQSLSRIRKRMAAY